MSKTICDTDALPIAEVADQLSNLLDEITASHKRIVIEKDGVAVATLVSMDDIRRLDQLDTKTEDAPPTGNTGPQTSVDVIGARLAAIQAIRQTFADVDPEEVERETAKAVAEVRAEMKAERDGLAQSA